MRNQYISRDVIEYSDEQIDKAYKICEGKHYEQFTNIVCLGQSDNSKDVMFVLYQYRKPNNSYSPLSTMQFKQILSNDLVRACEKAREICGDSFIAIENDVNVSKISIRLLVEDFKKDNPTIVPLLEMKNHIARDINRFLETKGYITNAQIELLRKIDERNRKWAEEKKESMEKSEKYSLLEDHHFNVKDRVEVTISDIISKVSFDTEWGHNHVIKYLTTCDKIVMYSGTSPKEINVGDTIKGTVKHNTYKGTKQTLLQRLSLVKPKK